MKKLTAEELQAAEQAFAYDGTPVGMQVNNEGHINDTQAVTVEKDGRQRRYILQRINTDVFHDPVALMDNIVKVTEYLQQKIRERGGDPDRETLTLVWTKPEDGTPSKPYFKDAAGNYFRSYLFVENTVCYDHPDRPEYFRESGRAFGEFQGMLAGLPADNLTESIPDFHNTAVRLANFRKAVEEDPVGRGAGVQQEIRFLLDRTKYADEMTKALQTLPHRVCHNDAKLSNVLFDKATGKALCVIDLDTVMPGLAMTDFGDAIRFGASTAAEDEPDLSKVHFDKSLYDVFLDGFLEGCGSALTQAETAMFPEAAKIITYEQALRFLGDYLENDVYYHTSRPGQNLDRTRTQIRLLEEMEEQL